MLRTFRRLPKCNINRETNLTFNLVFDAENLRLGRLESGKRISPRCLVSVFRAAVSSMRSDETAVRPNGVQSRWMRSARVKLRV
jgi:hypothetical protein